jgi:hypothetical protein
MSIVCQVCWLLVNRLFGVQILKNTVRFLKIMDRSALDLNWFCNFYIIAAILILKTSNPFITNIFIKHFGTAVNSPF